MIKEEEKSAGGIIIGKIVAREKDATEDCVIEQMGMEAFNDLHEEERNLFKVGSKVFISRYSGKTCGTYPDGDERRVISSTGILALIEEE